MHSTPNFYLPKYRELLELLEFDSLQYDRERRHDIMIILRFILNNPNGISGKQIREYTRMSEIDIKKALQIILIRESPFYLFNKYVCVVNVDNWIHKEVIFNTRSGIDETEDRILIMKFEARNKETVRKY